MHNLYLGCAKHILKAVWIEKGILTYSDFDVMMMLINVLCPQIMEESRIRFCQVFHLLLPINLRIGLFIFHYLHIV